MTLERVSAADKEICVVAHERAVEPVGVVVTGQLADTPTRGVDKSRIRQLAASQMPPNRTRSPAIAEGPRDAGVPVEIW